VSIYYIVASAAILILFFILAVKFKIFDLKGSIVALIVGIIILVFGSLYWLLLMLIFAITAQLATRYRLKDKQAAKLQEGENGERHTSNVMYAAVIGIVIAVMHFAKIGGFPYFLIFGVSFASVNADTFASEIGVFDKNVYMITGFKKITPGINGGISLLGEGAALLGALIIGISYIILDFHGFEIIPIIVITALGFIGCQIDSLLGALFENRGKMSKGQVNAISTLLAVVLAFVLYI
jgi:uncharacterized protein (TIGR00297 family)